MTVAGDRRDVMPAPDDAARTDPGSDVSEFTTGYEPVALGVVEVGRPVGEMRGEVARNVGVLRRLPRPFRRRLGVQSRTAGAGQGSP